MVTPIMAVKVEGVCSATHFKIEVNQPAGSCAAAMKSNEGACTLDDIHMAEDTCWLELQKGGGNSEHLPHDSTNLLVRLR